MVRTHASVLVLASGMLLAGCLQDFNQFLPGSGGGSQGGATSSTSTMTTVSSSSMSSSAASMMCPTDCNDMNPCTTDTCDMTTGTCKNDPVTDGDLANPDPNDCKKDVCQSGAMATVNDDTEIPDDANDCTTDTCSGGMPMHANLPDHTMCGTNGAFECLAGKCGCNVPGDCGTDPECATRTCDNNVCGFNFLNGDSPMQTAGDCKKRVCPGNDTMANEVNDNDPMDDGNECTADTCSAGMNVHNNQPAGFTCMTNKECDGAGVCCTPNGTACNGKQCGMAIDNCNAMVTCTSMCSGSQLGCVANMCTECDMTADCAANNKGHSCLASNSCGCTSNANCSGISGKTKCELDGPNFMNTCQACGADADCTGQQCRASDDTCVECTGNTICAANNKGHECLASNLCGCTVANEGTDCSGVSGKPHCATSGANNNTCQECDIGMNSQCSASTKGKTCQPGNVCGCTAATEATDCAGLTGKTHCATSGANAGTCVECDDDNDCNSDSDPDGRKCSPSGGPANTCGCENFTPDCNGTMHAACTAHVCTG